jgi:hypothetical protein
MANLKTFSGFPIQNLTSDPVPYAQALADNPYSGAWASQTSLNTTRSQAAGFGTVSNMGVAGGNTGSVVNNFELWNGSSWTETTEINTARRNARGVGAYTQGMIFGGYTATAGSANTETWNGSAWTEVNDMTRPGGQQSQASFGTYTDAIAAGGEPGTGSFQLVEKWDGTNWTEVNELNTGRQSAMGFGIITSGFVIGGYSPPSPPGNVVTNVESFNGTSFTETTDINTARGGGGATGNTTAGLIYGGQNPGSSARTETESWNGSAWTEVADLATGRTDGSWTPSPSSNNTSALFVSGAVPGSPGFSSATEEWAFSGLNPATTPAADYSDAIVGQIYYNSTSGQFKAIKTGVGSWASGTSMPSASAGRGMAGPTTAAIAYGGTGPPGTASQTLTEYYDGSSWSEQADLNQGRFMGSPATLGSQTAALFAGGAYNGTNQANVESWNGSAWSEVNNVPTAAHSYAAGAGTQTAALSIGAGPPNRALVASWDGSNWTDVAELNTGRYFNSAAGTQTAGITFSGDTGPPTFTANTETYNGSSWTEVAELNTARATGGGAGTQTSALMITGNTYPPIVANVEQWDGTSWTEVAEIRPGSTGATASNAMIAGGQPPYMANVEEWEIPGFAINTVTTS